MTAPTIADVANARIRQELAVRLTHGHDAVLRRVPDLYRRIIGEALAAEQGQLGQAAKLRAAQRALDRVADIGVVDFVDSAGRRWNMQSYIEMAVRTAAMRAMVDAQTQVYRQRGLSLVRVSDHSGACPVCAPFEGRLLAIDAMPDGDTSPDRNGTRIEVVATVADAIAAGLMHPNCRHTIHPWRPGVSVLPAAHPYNPAEYEAQQRLRAMERQVRHWRRREAAALTPEAKDKAARKITGWQGEIRRHVDTTGARRLYGREQTDRPLVSPTPRPPRPVQEQPRPVEQAALVRSVLDEWTGDATRIAGITQPETRDAMLAEIWRVQGYDHLPRVVTADEYAQLDAGYTRIYRGIAGTQAEQWAEDLRSGDWFPGLGAYGNGAYTTTDEQAARGYSTSRGWRGATADGVVVRMALRPGARTITLEQLRIQVAIDDRLSKGAMGRAFGDPGRLAAALGYDAIVFTPDPTEAERYYVVLNRRALVVEAAQ